jgi:RNA polymerase subunit RPABC4/transcription elongation factor Spt4
MVLAIWDDGVWQDAARFAVVGLVAYLLVLWVAALVWTYRDSAARSRDPMMQAIAMALVLVFNLPGLLVYLILRPKATLIDTYDRQLEAEALLHEIQDQATCPACRRKIEHDYVACPFCRTTLRTPCDNCARPMSSTWVLCPYCGRDQTIATSANAPASAPPPGAPRVKRASTATYTPPAATTQPADSGAEVRP